MAGSTAIELKNITKRFGSIVANKGVNLKVYEGEILSILGENGSGKTTLMNMIAGIYFPDEGHIYVRGQEAVIRSPRDAFDLGIGMIHQHFKLVDVFSAAENIVLGLDEKGRYDIRKVAQRVREISERYGFDIDPNKKIHEMSVSEKQTVEIVKVLYRGADILILDEPTAVLTPQETKKLFDVLRRMRDDGKSIIIISREGVKLLDDITFTARSGEILGIAGIAGSGQRELLEAIAGLQHLDKGEILYNNPKTKGVDNLRDKTPMQIRELGVRLSFVPEDRLGMGLVGSMDIVDNMMLRSYRGGHSLFVQRKEPKDLAQRIISELEVVTPNANTPVRRLSGGNVQKVLVGREIAAAPTVLMAAYPVRGLDINSSYMIYNLLSQQKENGVAVIFVGEDLDVLLELCDRILVIGGGRVTGIVDARSATKEQIGLLMTTTKTEAEQQ